MFGKVNTILVLAPHPDDAEFGLGGTLIKLISAGKKVHIAVFSTCEESTPKGFKKGIIIEEFRKACKFLNLPDSQVHFFDFKVRYFTTYRQEILEELIKLKQKIAPDLIFTPTSSDVHQDHQTICQESKRAFKHTCLLGYEMPWNNFTFNSSAFVTLNEEVLKKKLSLLSSYKSQSKRVYSSSSIITAMASLRGMQANSKYAESFEVIRYFDI